MNQVQTQFAVLALILGSAAVQADPIVYVHTAGAISSRSALKPGVGFRPVERGWTKKDRHKLSSSNTYFASLPAPTIRINKFYSSEPGFYSWFWLNSMDVIEFHGDFTHTDSATPESIRTAPAVAWGWPQFRLGLDRSEGPSEIRVTIWTGDLMADNSWEDSAYDLEFWFEDDAGHPLKYPVVSVAPREVKNILFNYDDIGAGGFNLHAGMVTLKSVSAYRK